MILGNGDSLIHFNGLKQKLKVLNKGVFSVSNGDLDNSWPKCQKISHEIENQLSLNDPEEIADNLFKVLLNKDIANDESLPDTGIGIDLERILSPPFIQTPLYGTRSSTVIIMGQKQAFCFNQNHQKESKIQRFEIELLC